jgi:hypothetical protein
LLPNLALRTADFGTAIASGPGRAQDRPRDGGFGRFIRDMPVE